MTDDASAAPVQPPTLQREGLALVPSKRSGRPVIVAGAAGLIGSQLCGRLIDDGETVLALDNLSSGDVGHLAHLLHHPRLHFEHLDITDPLPKWTRDAGAIYNLACPGSRLRRERHPAATMLASTVGVWRLLELARGTGARLLQASGAQVYGDAQVHPQNERYCGHVDPGAARSCADEGLRSAEALCLSYAREHRVQIRIARLFDCYGPRFRADDGRVVGTLLLQALSGQPLTIHGDGRQKRSFCHVDDVVDGVTALMSSGMTGPVNLGNPVEITVLALAERVLRITASRSRLEFVAARPDDARRRWPDIELAVGELGWRPRITLDQGLRLIVDEIRTAVDASASAQVVQLSAPTTAAVASLKESATTTLPLQASRRVVGARA